MHPAKPIPPALLGAICALFLGSGMPGPDTKPAFGAEVGPAAYYASAVATSPAQLRLSLHELIDDHTRVPYSSSATDTWDVLERSSKGRSLPLTARLLDGWRLPFLSKKTAARLLGTCLKGPHRAQLGPRKEQKLLVLLADTRTKGNHPSPVRRRRERRRRRAFSGQPCRRKEMRCRAAGMGSPTASRAAD